MFRMRSPLRAACKRLSYPVAVARVSPTLDPYSTLDVAETKVVSTASAHSALRGFVFKITSRFGTCKLTALNMIAIEDPDTGLLIDQPSPAAPNADPAAYKSS